MACIRTTEIADETMLRLLPQCVPNAKCQLQSSVLQNMITQVGQGLATGVFQTDHTELQDKASP